MTEIDLTLPGFLDRRSEPKPPIYSFTFLNLYRNICPYQAYRRHIKKDLPFIETAAMQFGNKVHSALELRVGGGKPLPKDMQRYEKFAAPFYAMKAKAEMKLGITKAGAACEFFAKDVWLRGKADIVVTNGDNALLADWKTGSAREDPFELECQALLLHAKFPNLKSIEGVYVWLKDDRVGQKHNVSHTSDTFTYVQRIVADLEEDMRNNDFEKRRGGLCDWCKCDDCEHFTGGNGR